MEQVDCVVIGAGVVGLAVARALAQAGREVVLLEAAAAIGTGTSSRNSEVIHAGLYYPPGSLKARLCVRGRELLYAYCAERGIAHRRCGKLIVATEAAQEPALQALRRRAEACGVHDLQWMDAMQARALEPALHCTAALLSPSTGIVDSHGLMLSLQGDAEAHGAMLALMSPLQRLRRAGDQLRAGRGRRRADAAAGTPRGQQRRLACGGAGCGLRRTAADAAAAVALGARTLLRLPGQAGFHAADLPDARRGRAGRACHARPGRADALRPRRAMGAAHRARRGGLPGRPGAGPTLCGGHPPLLAGVARRCAAAGLCRHPAEDQRPGRGSGRLPGSRAQPSMAWPGW